jgi:hypothetical protein
MAIVYTNAIKDSRMQVVIDATDAGVAAGTLEIGTAGMASTLITFTLADPSATTAAGVLTLSGLPLNANAAATGTAAEARIRDSDSNDVVTGLTVGTSGTDIIISSVSITSGQQYSVTSATFTHG